MISLEDVKLKEAIVKYLNNEWGDSEQEALKQIRKQLAAAGVPKVLAISEQPIAPDTIDSFVNVLVNEPSSEKGKATRDYLRALGKKPRQAYDRGSREAPEVMGGIELAAKLHYINNTYFRGVAEVRGVDDGIELQYGAGLAMLTLHPEPGVVAVTFRDGRVEIEGNFEWEKVLNSSPKTAAIRVYYPSLLGVDFSGTGETNYEPADELKIAVVPSSTVDQVAEAAINHMRKRITDAFDSKASRLDKLSLRYEVLLGGAKVTNRSIVVSQYSAEIGTILDKVL